MFLGGRAFWYIRSVVTITFKNGFFLIALGALTALFAVPALFPLGTSGQVFMPAYYEAALHTQEGAVVSITGQVPEVIRETQQEKKRLLQEIVDAKGSSQYYEKVAVYEQYASDTLGLGGTLLYEGTFDPHVVYRATALLATQIAELDVPEVYARSADAPALFYIAYYLCSIPYPLVFLPLFAAICVLAGAKSRRRLMATLPLAEPIEYAYAVLALALVCLLGLVVMCIPGLIISLFHNGWGSLSYPVVYVVGERIVLSDIGTVIGSYLLLFCLACVFLSMLTCATLLVANPVLARVVLAVVLLVPLFQSVLTGIAPDWLVGAVPTSYLIIPSITGYPSYVIGGPIAARGVGTLEAGLVSLSLGCFVATAVLLLDYAFRRIRSSLTDGGR